LAHRVVAILNRHPARDVTGESLQQTEGATGRADLLHVHPEMRFPFFEKQGTHFFVIAVFHFVLLRHVNTYPI